MKQKITILLVVGLALGGLYLSFNPVKAVRYNIYDKSVNCAQGGEFSMPEACAEFVDYSLAQTISSWVILSSSFGLTFVGSITLLTKSQSHRRKS